MTKGRRYELRWDREHFVFYAESLAEALDYADRRIEGIAKWYASRNWADVRDDARFDADYVTIVARHESNEVGSLAYLERVVAPQR